MAATSNNNALLPLQRFIQTLQTLRRSPWLDRLRRHHPHQPTRAFAEDFIRVTTLLLAYVTRHNLLPELSSSSSSTSSSRMRRERPRRDEGVHVRRVHRETLFAMLVRLHQYFETLRRIVRHGRQQQVQPDDDLQQLSSEVNHRHCIDVLYAFTNFHVNAGVVARR